ncbi:MAG: hypothetical protein ACRDY0_09950 [Acidimicrobiales bacterium]
MARPLPDPAKLLEAWMEWERGDTPPGRVMANMKTGGLRVLLEELVALRGDKAGADVPDEAAAESWTPVV